jgi:xanthine dehydrogenase accessory factor
MSIITHPPTHPPTHPTNQPPNQPTNHLIIIKGVGDLASGVAHRLHQAGFAILITELPQPLVVRRTVAFAAAVHDGAMVIEAVRACRVNSWTEAQGRIAHGDIAVMVDPQAQVVREAQPLAIVDAIMAKRNTGTTIHAAPIVVALGPGFTVGVDCHAIVETKRGHNLGRVYYQGAAEADTAIPAEVNGFTRERVLRAPLDGVFHARAQIGQSMIAPCIVGHVVSEFSTMPIIAEVSGVVRGLIAHGTPVTRGLKIGDIDPRGIVAHCFTISDKARAIGGGVLEAILHLELSVNSVQ